MMHPTYEVIHPTERNWCEVAKLVRNYKCKYDNPVTAPNLKSKKIPESIVMQTLGTS